MKISDIVRIPLEVVFIATATLLGGIVFVTVMVMEAIGKLIEFLEDE